MANDKNRTSSRELAQHFVSFQQNSVPLVPEGAKIEPAELKALRSNDMPTYRQIKATFKADLTSRDSRFRLSDQVAGQLSVEKEEELRFQKRVEEEVASRLVILKAEAHSQGFAKGSEEGAAKAFEEEKVKIAKSIEGMAGVIKTLHDAKEKLSEDYEAELIQLAFKIAEGVVHQQISDRPEIVSASIKAILNRIGKEDDVRVRLSTEAFDVLDRVKQEISDVSRQGRISFEADHALKGGSCVVESLSGEISSGIEESLAKVRAELSKNLQAKKKASQG